jgi:hypothetical protein
VDVGHKSNYVNLVSISLYFALYFLSALSLKIAKCTYKLDEISQVSRLRATKLYGVIYTYIVILHTLQIFHSIIVTKI